MSINRMFLVLVYDIHQHPLDSLRLFTVDFDFEQIACTMNECNHGSWQVFREAPSLFRDLETLFSDSWARPGVDLQPEMRSLGCSWHLLAQLS